VSGCVLTIPEPQSYKHTENTCCPVPRKGADRMWWIQCRCRIVKLTFCVRCQWTIEGGGWYLVLTAEPTQTVPLPLNIIPWSDSLRVGISISSGSGLTGLEELPLRRYGVTGAHHLVSLLMVAKILMDLNNPHPLQAEMQHNLFCSIWLTASPKKWEPHLCVDGHRRMKVSSGLYFRIRLLVESAYIGLMGNRSEPAFRQRAFKFWEGRLGQCPANV
jgi:hypothetical protein